MNNLVKFRIAKFNSLSALAKALDRTMIRRLVIDLVEKAGESALIASKCS